MTITYRPATNNECFQIGQPIKPLGVMIHSTGCNQTSLSVYYRLFNVFHPGGRQTCPHAFIGKNDAGRIETWQLLPWERIGWHSGSGSAGNANRMGFIGIELCEDDLSDSGYFWRIFKEAVEVSAHLCRAYGIPAARVICHSEGHAMGIASNHADVMHWFPKHGADMNYFREEVDKLVDKSMNTSATAGAGTAGDQADTLADSTHSQVTANSQLKTDDSTPSPGAEEAVAWAQAAGILRGDPDGSLRLRDPVTREEAVIMLHRLAKLNETLDNVK